MKLRTGFISNSSATSFTITNISNKKKTTADFVREVGEEILKNFERDYGHNSLPCRDDEGVTLEQLIKEAKSGSYHKVFKPGQSRNMAFGDEQGPALGHLFDYSLRDGGKSKSFTWKFHEWLR
jgi:hypothetical protein